MLDQSSREATTTRKSGIETRRRLRLTLKIPWHPTLPIKRRVAAVASNQRPSRKQKRKPSDSAKKTELGYGRKERRERRKEEEERVAQDPSQTLEQTEDLVAGVQLVLPREEMRVGLQESRRGIESVAMTGVNLATEMIEIDAATMNGTEEAMMTGGVIRIEIEGDMKTKRGGAIPSQTGDDEEGPDRSAQKSARALVDLLYTGQRGPPDTFVTLFIRLSAMALSVLVSDRGEPHPVNRPSEALTHASESDSSPVLLVIDDWIASFLTRKA